MQFLNSPNLQQTRPHGLILSTCRWAGVQCATTGKHKSLGVSAGGNPAHKGPILGARSMQTLHFPELCLFTARQRGQPILLSASPCQKAERPCPEGCVLVWASAAHWFPPFYCLALSGCLGAARPHCIGMSRGSKSRIPLNFSDEKGAFMVHAFRDALGPALAGGGEAP